MIGLWTLIEFLGLIALWLQCTPFDECVSRDYGAWMLHLLLSVSFVILAASRGNLASRKLLRNAIVLETVILFFWTTIGAIIWYPMDYTEKVCEMPTIDLYRQAKIDACSYDGTDRENFSIDGTTGVTSWPSDPDWNPATFSSQRAPYCADYQSFVDYKTEECPKAMNITVIVYLLIFYLIYIPLRGYFIFKIHEYVKDGEEFLHFKVS